jgi:hypothetical protein
MTDEMLAAMLDETPTHTGCRASNTRGEPCAAPEQLVENGYCAAHRPGGAEEMRARGVLGGAAKALRDAGEAFTPDQLPPLQDLESAKAALDAVRVAVLCRRISANEGNAASKAVSEWVKTETAAITARLVNELRAELDNRAKEIADLRKQLARAAGRAR